MLPPATDQFAALEGMFDYFNERLFNGQLPRVVLAFSRQRVATAFLGPAPLQKQPNIAHEIAFNLVWLANARIELVASALVHEQAHLWQHAFGTPGRRGYHNHQWARKMRTVGLVPTTTGQPGGKPTGERVSQYPSAGGPFDQALRRMPAQFASCWRFNVSATSTPNSRSKVKYSCPCKNNAWGKRDLSLLCGRCGKAFERQGENPRGLCGEK